MNKSVYNFIPAPKEANVFYPKWAEQVSMDIPFKNAESGEIEIELEALSPIFIKNGNKENEFSFSHYIHEGKIQYFIPGTSLKGMIRNVLEILSYSKLNPNLVNNYRYAYRDLNNSIYKGNYTNDKIKGGFLKKENGKYYISDCGKPKRISHEEIDQKLNLPKDQGFVHTFSKKTEKTAKYKYELLSKLTKKRLNTIKKDDKDYYLIVTGQPREHGGKFYKGSVKYHEFLFEKHNKYNKIEVPEEMIADLRFIYGEGDNNESKDWAMWKKNLEIGKSIPVFFSQENNKLLHLGLTFMYKLPYKNRIHQMLPISEYSKDKRDLAETLFGYTSTESLKGRISFGHAKGIENCTEIEKLELVLSSPKASFYPYYLVQKSSQQVTYDENTATLRGFKRYPTRKELLEPNNSNNDNEKIKTILYPLNKGAKFKGKVRFFNLKPEELGALLSALTFHNKSECNHNLGMGKPFGLGKIKLSINHIISNGKKVDSNTYIELFGELMTTHKSDWITSEPLKELFEMASNTNDNYLDYMNIKDFSKIKKNKSSLPKFSKIKHK